MDVDVAKNSSMLILKTPWNYDGMCQCHARPLSLYPPAKYSHVSDHSVTVGVAKIMLFIGTNLDVTHWRNLMHKRRYYLWLNRRCCGTHFFTLPIKCRSIVRKYHASEMKCAELLRLPMRHFSLYIFIFVKARDSLMIFIQVTYFLLVNNKPNDIFWMSHTSHINWGGLRHGADVIWCVSVVMLDFWPVPPKLGHQLLD